MFGRAANLRTGHAPPHAAGAWPVVLMLLAAALVPAGCVLWFMNAAMANEQLAMRQRLADAYRQHLTVVRERLEAEWAARKRAIDAAESRSPAEAFAGLVTAGVADGVVVMDGPERVAYPADVEVPDDPDEMPEAWDAAAVREARGELKEAAELYRQVAIGAVSVDLTARALQARGRVLAKAGDVSQAIGVLRGELGRDEYRAARDESGRLIAPAALLYAARLAKADGTALRNELLERVEDYSGPAMSSAQRRLLLQELAELGVRSPMLAAEELSASCVGRLRSDAAATTLSRGPIDGVSMLRSTGGRVVGLWRDATVASTVAQVADALPAGARIELYEAASWARSGGEPVVAAPVGGVLKDWRLAMYIDGVATSAADGARRRVLLYLWTGAAGVVVIAGMALAAGRYVSRQMALTRLKNDLIATASHELKTPLASMRVLVDSLLEDPAETSPRAREYLQLIARENQRLSRLIDNFLTFSRMERNKRAFESLPVAAAEVARLAAEAVAERFAAPGHRLEVEIDECLPPVVGDRDALVTAVVNLLDNAHKYTGDQKHVRLHATADADQVVIAVTDNGIGLSRTASRRVFERFYQVDQTLARKVVGVGLGLSIVKFIVEAHGGTVAVDSQPGSGSRFTIRLPASGVTQSNQPEVDGCPAAAKPS